MSWQYRLVQNEHGHEQSMDYSQCPPIAVCSSCHSPYTNHIGEKTCSDCRGVHDAPNETGQTTEEITNEFGFIDHALLENGEPVFYTASNSRIVVCPQCFAMVMKNRGVGCLCGDCRHNFDIECQHDHADDYL